MTFRVTQRSIRDRYLLLERRYKKKVAEEEKACGISLEPTELDRLMEDFVTLFKEADKAEVEGIRRRKLEEEAAEIQEIRRVSLETFKETKETQMKNLKRNREQVVLML